MKKRTITTLLASLVCVASLVGPAEAVDFNDYKTNYTTTYMKPLAKDIGALLGAGTFRNAALMGFPSVNAEGQMIFLNNGESPLLKNQMFGMPYAKVEIGLPVINADIFIRGMMYNNLTIGGGGVKYALPLFPSVPAAPTPSLAVVASYHVLRFGSGTDKIDATVMSVNGVLSYGFPGVPVEPFIGAGMDFSSLTAKLASNTDLVVSDTGTRLVGGLNVSIFPLVYASGEVALANTSTLYGLKVGIKLP